MKIKTSLALAAAIGILGMLLTAGCTSLMDKALTPTTTTLPILGTVTNQPAAVAYLSYAQEVNDEVNTSQSRQPIDAAIGSLTTLLAALSGWWMRHKATSAVGTTTTTNPPKS